MTDPLARTGAPRPDVFDRACPSRRILGAISGKWSLLVIDALGGGPLRTGALRRRVDGISQKMLTETLRDLETLNLVARRSMGTVPPHVEYGLTELGLSLRALVSGIDRWVEANLDPLSGPAPGRRSGPAG